LNDGSNCGYGFGLDFGAEAKPYKNHNVVTHAGRTGGFCSIILRFPEKRFTVIVLSNFQQFDRIGAALEVADVFLFNNKNPRSFK
jgi:CubicO group peptidase (beta-lactamase class C family)